MTELRRTLASTDMIPLAPSKLVVRDGFVGVFTPIAEQGTTSETGTSNLQQIVDRLTAEVGTLQQKNVELQTRLDRTLAPATSSEDLAAALQRTVNRLQNELASLSNPISNFAVKDFRLETSLCVGITELGSVEFRLLQPGANVDPAAISKLSLSLVPIEKQRVEGSFASELFEPEKELATIGVTAPLREVLERNHIFTIGEFRAAAMRAQVRTSLIATERTTQAELALLQARAELALLAGVDGTIADTLIAANIDSLRALASCSAEGLALILPRAERAMLTRWVEAAQTFLGKDSALALAQQFVVSLNTEPAAFLARLGETPFAAAPITRRVSAGKPIAMRTLRAQIRSHTGYQFETWSNGAKTTAIVEAPAANIAATAQFKLAGYWLHAVTPNEGGILRTNPPTGGLAHLPATFFAAGSEVELVADPAPGYVLRTLAVTTQGKTRNVDTKSMKIAVQAPIEATATFMARPMTLAWISAPFAMETGGFGSRVTFTNREPVPAFDVRVTDVRFVTVAGTGDVKLRGKLPIVIGDLAPHRESEERLLAYDIPKTVAAFEIHLTVALRNASGNVLYDTPSIAARHPGAALS